MARSGGLRTFVTRSILLLARKLADYSMPAERLGEIARAAMAGDPGIIIAAADLGHSLIVLERETTTSGRPTATEYTANQTRSRRQRDSYRRSLVKETRFSV